MLFFISSFAYHSVLFLSNGGATLETFILYKNHLIFLKLKKFGDKVISKYFVFTFWIFSVHSLMLDILSLLIPLSLEFDFLLSWQAFIPSPNPAKDKIATVPNIIFVHFFIISPLFI